MKHIEVSHQRLGPGMTFYPRALGLALLASAFLRFLENLFLDIPYSWDLDSFLYLGSRLGRGELLFMRDFETKSPAIQYLFYVVNALGGIGSWRILLFCTVTLFGYLGSFVLARDLARRCKSPLYDTRTMAFLFTGVFSALFYSFRDATISQIDMFSSPIAFLSFSILTSGWQGRRERHAFLAAGCALSLAALIRSYYVYHLGFAFFWLLVYSPGGTQRRDFMRLIFFSAGVSLTFLAAFAPYFFVPGGLESLRDGFVTIWNFSSGTRLGSLQSKQFDSGGMRYIFFGPLYMIFLLLSAMVLVPRIVALRGFRGHVLFNLSALALLNYAFTRNHFWQHYILIFVPFFVHLLCIVAYALIRDGLPFKGSSLGMPARKIMLVISALLILAAFYRPASTLRKLYSGQAVFDPFINDAKLDKSLLAYLDACKREGKSFLVVSDARYHRLLGESRIGDGHPFILVEILGGKSVGPVGGIRLFSERVREDKCLSIAESGKDILVFGYDKAYEHARRCLHGKGGVYKRDTTTGIDGHVIYRLMR